MTKGRGFAETEVLDHSLNRSPHTTGFPLLCTAEGLSAEALEPIQPGQRLLKIKHISSAESTLKARGSTEALGTVCRSSDVFPNQVPKSQMITNRCTVRGGGLKGPCCPAGSCLLSPWDLPRPWLLQRDGNWVPLENSRSGLGQLEAAETLSPPKP